MLEVTRDTGQPVYIAPSHVVAVMPVSGGDNYAEIVLSAGPNIKVRGRAKQIAQNVSNALGR
jgi:hypothetical protein